MVSVIAILHTRFERKTELLPLNPSPRYSLWWRFSLATIE